MGGMVKLKRCFKQELTYCLTSQWKCGLMPDKGVCLQSGENQQADVMEYVQAQEPL